MCQRRNHCTFHTLILFMLVCNGSCSYGSPPQLCSSPNLSLHHPVFAENVRGTLYSYSFASSLPSSFRLMVHCHELLSSLRHGSHFTALIQLPYTAYSLQGSHDGHIGEHQREETRGSTETNEQLCLEQLVMRRFCCAHTEMQHNAKL